MKRKPPAPAVCALVCTYLLGVRHTRGAENIIPDINEALIESGFVSVNADYQTGEVGPDLSYITRALIGDARLEMKQIVFRADRVLFIYYPSEGKRGITHPFEVYAEGNVIVCPGKEYIYGPKAFLQADALYYDGRTLQGLAANVALRADGITFTDTREVPTTLALLAKELRFRGKVKEINEKTEKSQVRFHSFLGKDITVSTCDMALPHWGLMCEQIEAEEEEENEGEYTGNITGEYLAAFGHRILPLAPLAISTRYIHHVPLRHIEFLSSRRFGYGFRSVWTLNRTPGTSQALRYLEEKTGVPLEADVDFDVMSDRGIGVGGQLRYGRNPEEWQEGSWKNITGDFRGYYIHDHGEDRNEELLYPNNPPETWRKEDRYRIRGWHRMELPFFGSLDAEISKWEDRNFYKEFFERELFNNREPETYLLWQRKFGQDVLTSVLYRPRVNDFQNYKERLPEGTIELFPTRVSEAIGPTLEGELRAGYLRFQPDEFNADTVDSFSTGRYHGEGTAALPLGVNRYVRVRPFYTAYGTIYENRYQRPDGAQRLVQAAGVTASTQVWRNYPGPSELLKTQALRHVIVPRVTYYNAFDSNHSSDEFFPFDEIDSIDKLQYLELAVATYLLGKRNKVDETTIGAVQRLLELRARVRYFPQASRDNVIGGEGGEVADFSNVYLDVFSDIIHPSITVGIESEIDISRGRGLEVFDPYVSVSLPGRINFSAGQLFIKGDDLRGIGPSNYLWGKAYWFLSDTYALEGYIRYDFKDERIGEQFFGISRAFHCVTLETGIEIDRGDDEVKWTVHVYPSGNRKARR